MLPFVPDRSSIAGFQTELFAAASLRVALEGLRYS
jgi:hypothetical protein